MSNPISELSQNLPGQDVMVAYVAPQLNVPCAEAPPDLSYNQVLSVLRGKGKLRKPKKGFWPLWEDWKKTLQLAGLRIFHNGWEWKADISDFSQQSLDWAHVQIQSP